MDPAEAAATLQRAQQSATDLPPDVAGRIEALTARVDGIEATLAEMQQQDIPDVAIEQPPAPLAAAVVEPPESPSS